MPRWAHHQTLATLAWLAAFVAIPYTTPRLARLRLFDPRQDATPAPSKPVANEPSFGEAKLSSATDERPELAQPAPADLPAALPLIVEKKPPRSIEDPTGHAMDAFYASLAKTREKREGAITRITHFGDSLLVTDWVTGTLRRKLQGQFGDAGHGFLLLAAGWPGYFHNDVLHTASPGWMVSRVVGPRSKDGLYGLGGVSFRSPGAGTWARFATAKKGDFGRNVSRFVVSYLAEPGGGAMELLIDGAPSESIDTSADEVRAATHVTSVPDGPHTFELRPKGPVRGFGVWLERDEPGIVYDAIGILGARMRALLEEDPAHFAQQLGARSPNLVVFEYGINEAEDGDAYPLAELEVSSTKLLEQTRAALPDASCLVIGALDRTDLRDGVYVSRNFIPRLVATQRKAAFAAGCAFFDVYQAMGGRGSMGRWVERGLGGKDLAHPSSAGAEVLGNWIYRALVEPLGEAD